MTCRVCGGEVNREDRVCRHCGAALPLAKGNSRPRGMYGMIAAVLSGLALLCVGVVLLFYFVLRDLGGEQTQQPDDQTVESQGEPADDAVETIRLPDTSAQGAGEPAEETQTEQSEEAPAVTLTLSASELSLRPGTQSGLSVSVDAPSGMEVYVFWSSSDPSVAEIDSSGMVTAIAEGECVMTASSGEYSATCQVRVSADAGEAGYLLPSDTRLLTQSDLEGMTREEVQLARNEIFARHGRVFQTASIQAYFDACAWYVPDPDYDEDEPGALSEIEQANVRFLVEYETSQGWR